MTRKYVMRQPRRHAKVTAGQIAAVRKLVAAGVSTPYIARATGLHRCTVWRLVKRYGMVR